MTQGGDGDGEGTRTVNAGVVGLAAGMALGFAGYFGGFGAFLLVGALGAVGFVAGRILDGDLEPGDLLRRREFGAREFRPRDRDRRR